MTGTATQVDVRSLDPPIHDIWSRTEWKYRRRAIILLTVNVVLFFGLCCVAYWLRTGIFFAPGAADYWEQFTATFRPTPDTEHTPTGLSLAPISIEQVPMMIPVLGLILAALVSIPVLTAILYRMACAIPFILSVGFVAVMPWLAIVLLASCLLASVRPFKSRSKFASALMSLLPVILYFFMASRQTEPAVDVLANPADRIKVLAPLILAVLASAIVMGIVLIIAHIVKYRPGAISPLLTVLFLTPVAIFEFGVGRDELYYRLLESEYGPSSDYFMREEAASAFDAAVAAERKRSGQSAESARALVETRWSLALDPELGQVLHRYKQRAVAAALGFIRSFPDSVYAPNALYVQARTQDMRVDLVAFATHRRFDFYADFPSEASRWPWTRIEHHAQSSPLGTVARLRLAQLDARLGQVDEAIAWLVELDRKSGSTANAQQDQASSGIFERRSTESSLGIPVARHLIEAPKLRQLLEANRDPLYGHEPLAAFMALDPRDVNRKNDLASLLAKFPRCQLQDNIELEMALAVVDPEQRSKLLENLVTTNPTADALPEAVFQLGQTYFEMKAYPGARSAFERVLNEFPNSLWAKSAEAELRKIERAKAEG